MVLGILLFRAFAASREILSFLVSAIPCGESSSFSRILTARVAEGSTYAYDAEPVFWPNAPWYIRCMALRLTNDFIFKYVFGREETKDILIDLINAVLSDSGFEPVASIVLRRKK